MGAFLSSIQLNSKVILEKINKECYRIAWDLFTGVVANSPSPSNPGPWADGLLANQWYPQAGSPSKALGADTSPNGSASLARINGMVKGREFFGKDGKLFLTNNLDYAFRAEYLGWHPPEWSGKSGSDGKGSPYMMVARSLQATVQRNKKIRIK